jgi:hypothetical protein
MLYLHQRKTAEDLKELYPLKLAHLFLVIDRSRAGLQLGFKSLQSLTSSSISHRFEVWYETHD